MAKYKTSALKDKFGCSPKTILRAMMNDPQASDWHDEAFEAIDIVKKYKMPSVAALDRVMTGRDDLIDAETAAKHMGISLRRFYQRLDEGTGPKKATDHGRIIRYLLSDILELDI